MTKKKDAAYLAGAGPQDGGGSRAPLQTPRKANRDRSRDVAEKLERFARDPPGTSELVPATVMDDDPESKGRRTAESESSDLEGGTVSTLLSSPSSKSSKKRLKPSEPTLRDVFLAVQNCGASLTSLTDQVQGMRADISFLRHDLSKVRDRTKLLETRISDMEDVTAPLSSDVKAVSKRLSDSFLKTEDIENRLRRNNIRAVGFPERIEGSDPTAFAETWLLATIGRESLSALFVVERAHRVPLRPLPPGGPPRPMLIRVLNYRDRESILRRARELGDVMFEGSKIMLFPDFSQEVQKRRAKFQDVKRRLRHLKFPYSMLYPARLRVISGDDTIFFETPLAASEWLDKHAHNRPDT